MEKQEEKQEGVKRKVGRPKGTPKTGGRVKGQPNKKTKFCNEFLQSVLDYYTEPDPETGVSLFLQDVEALTDPKDRLQILEKFYSYLVPKPQTAALFVKKEDTSVEEDLARLAGLV